MTDDTFRNGFVGHGCDYEPVKSAGLFVTAVAGPSDLIKPLRATVVAPYPAGKSR